jgi:hypothetical protein
VREERLLGARGRASGSALAPRAHQQHIEARNLGVVVSVPLVARCRCKMGVIKVKEFSREV